MYCPDQPPVGSLIAYEYLWLSQSQDRDDGAKTYPAAVIFAKPTVFGRTLAYVAAISHKSPTSTERAVQVPRKLKRHLGLDEDPSWIYLDQLNEFIWPGPDLQRADRLSDLPQAKGTCVIGQLPEGWFDMLKNELVKNLRLKQSRIIPRS